MHTVYSSVHIFLIGFQIHYDIIVKVANGGVSSLSSELVISFPT